VGSVRKRENEHVIVGWPIWRPDEDGRSRSYERLLIPIDQIWPSPENALLYHPVTPDDEATIAMADSIRANGILEPIVISADNYIISGHRRECAARITYRNDLRSYHSLIDLVTRARHEGYIDYQVIHDPTRPVTLWNVHKNLASYYAQQMEELLNGYWRDLMQSQPNHIEIVIEKNTLHGIITPVAAKFCIPLSAGRGQCSTRPLYDIAERYKASGKDKLIILAMSDLDPDGDAIAHSLGQRLRDDYHIRQVEVVKTALSMKQVRALKLPTKYERAKKKSSNYKRYVEDYGTDFVWELEAVAPKILQKLLTQAIDGVIDKAAFNAEVAQERADAAHNAAVREIVLRTLKAEITR
jgi:ParB/Sulfiredoxin domain